MGTCLVFNIDHTIYSVLYAVLRRFGTDHSVRGKLVAATMSTCLAYNVDHAILGVLGTVLRDSCTGQTVRRLFAAVTMGTPHLGSSISLLQVSPHAAFIVRDENGLLA